VSLATLPALLAGHRDTILAALPRAWLELWA
jgi:hypothetical protein